MPSPKYIMDLPPSATYDIDMWLEVQRAAGGVGSSLRITKSVLVDAVIASLYPIQHNALAGLLNDDHPQYLTTARGDARYALIGGGGGGGGGAVSSVNGQVGVVVLTAANVGAATAAQGTKADAAVVANAGIVGATKTKVTYDAKGLVTAGVDATTADIADSTNKRYVTDAEKVTWNGKETAFAKGSLIQGANVTLTGTLANRLVGTGDITVAAISSGSGTVTSVAVTTANGVSGSVATPTTTPAISLTLGAITPTSVAATGTVTGSNLSGTNTGDQTSVTGNAGTATALSAGADRTKLDGIAAGAEVNVNADWNSVSGDSQILNKPTLGTAAATNSTAYATAAQGTKADAAVVGNSAITGATKTKITYDAKGLVTAGADATTADIADSTNKRYVTDAQQTVIGNTSGTNTGDQTNISGNAATVTTNANLTGHVTSVGNATSLGSFTTAQLNAAISDGDVESAFTKGSIIQGANVVLTGTLANRLVGTGDITIAATGGGGGANLPAVMARTSLGF